MFIAGLHGHKDRCEFQVDFLAVCHYLGDIRFLYTFAY
jgi:hypothetical protein